MNGLINAPLVRQQAFDCISRGILLCGKYRKHPMCDAQADAWLDTERTVLEVAETLLKGQEDGTPFLTPVGCVHVLENVRHAVDYIEENAREMGLEDE